MEERTNKLLEERGKRYGEFSDLATMSQTIKDMWYVLAPDNVTPGMNEAMEMVIHKLCRVINGDRFYLDNIDDMIGYLELYRKEVLNTVNDIDIN